LRPLQKKHARNGSFFGCFFPRRPRRGGEWLPSSSSPNSSDSAPPAPAVPPPSRPSRCPRGSVSGYVINVRVCRKGLRGVGVGVRVRVDAGEGDCAHPRSTDGALRGPSVLMLTMSSGYGRWPIGDLPRGGRTGDSALGFVECTCVWAVTGTGATQWFCASGLGADAATYGRCCRSSFAGSGA
jgi:hypothetical protein